MDSEEVQKTLLILPVVDQVVFPGLNMTLAISKTSLTMLEDEISRNGVVGVMGVKKSPDGLPAPEQIKGTGTTAKILHVTETAENQTLVVVYGMKRFTVMRWLETKPHLKAEVAAAAEVVEADIETEALHRSLRDLTQEVFSMSLSVPKEAIEGLARIRSPLALGYIAAAHAEIDFDKRQQLLDEGSLKNRLRSLVAHFSREKEVLSLGKKIQSEAHDKMSKSQRDYFLRQQLKAIKKELGETDEESSEVEDYRNRIDEAEMSAEALKEADRELDRMAQMTPQSAEYPMVKTYLDWLLDLPWTHASQDQADIDAARRILDEDHYGLKEVKERILSLIHI